MTRNDGRRPDALTMFPWHSGKPLVWDVTCVSTLASSNINASQWNPGAAASVTEHRKRVKYLYLDEDYHFTPLGFKTMGHWGKSTVAFISKLGKELSQTTGEPRSTAFLKQRLSIAIQRGNCAAIRGTVVEGPGMSEIFNLPPPK